MNPKIWGPAGWLFLHSIAFGYPENPTNDDKKAAIDFFNSLQYLLPCKTCSELYKKDLKLFKNEQSLKNAVQSQKTLIQWVNLMHNKVNENLNKKQYTDDEYYNYYTKIYNNSNNNNKYSIGILILIFIMVIFYIFK